MSNGEIPHNNEPPADEQIPINGASLDSTTARVYALTHLQERRIFWSRNTKPEYQAALFFRTLYNERSITIIGANLEITSDSILRVKDKTGIIYRIPLSYYILLTETDPNREIIEYEKYILSSLSKLGISIAMATDDVTATETTLSDEEVDIYKPENIAGMRESGEFYTCKVYHERDAVLAFGEPYEFTTIDISLLDIMLVALHKAEDMDTTTQGVSLEVTHFKLDKTVVTIVPGGRVEYLLESALKRKNPMYQNMDFETAREHYMKMKVKTKLR